MTGVIHTLPADRRHRLAADARASRLVAEVRRQRRNRRPVQIHRSRVLPTGVTVSAN